MIRVENRKTLISLARQILKKNRKRNIIAIIAIALTTMLFTVTFTVVFSLKDTYLESQRRNLAARCDAEYMDGTEEGFIEAKEAVDKDKQVKEYGCGNYLGTAFHDILVYYGDDLYRRGKYCDLIEGSAPRKKNEILLSDQMLKDMEKPLKTGQKITVSIKVMKKTYKRHMIISGIYKGYEMRSNQFAWVSKELRDEILYPITGSELKKEFRDGSYMMTIWYKDQKDSGRKTEKLQKQIVDHDYEYGYFVKNVALDMHESHFPKQAVGYMLGLIIIAGYLIIYNVFYISVNVDAKVYGLLKNIGMTGKQLKRMVCMQIACLCGIGIPIGLLAGSGIGYRIIPLLVEKFGFDSRRVYPEYSMSPIIFICAGVFSLATVYISCVHSLRWVSHLTPTEAIHIGDGSSKKQKKRTSFVTPFMMALENVCRSWKKALLIMLSIAISILTLNTIYIIVNGFKFEEYHKREMCADFMISRGGDNLRMQQNNCITKEINTIIKECPGASQIGYVYYDKLDAHIDETMYKNLKKMEKEHIKHSARSKGCYDLFYETKEYEQNIIGITNYSFYKLNFKTKPCSWEDFAYGQGVLISSSNQPGKTSFYQVGDTITVPYRSGAEKYKVLGIIECSGALESSFSYSDFNVYIPKTDYWEHNEEMRPSMAIMDVLPDQDQKAYSYLNKKLGYSYRIQSTWKMKNDFNRFIHKYVVIGMALAGIFLVIAIMNYLNIISISIYARRQELALLEAVGMTKRQIQKILIYEGIIYIAGAFILEVIGVYFGTDKVVDIMGTQNLYFSAKLTILPCIVVCPFLLLIATGIPIYYYKRMKSNSIVDRIKM